MGGRGSKMCPDGLLCCTKDEDKNVQHFQEDQTSHAEKLAITAKQGETFKADLDSSKSSTQKKHMQDDTDSEDEDHGRGGFNGPRTQVIDHVGVMQFGRNSKVITNNYTVPKPKKKKPPQDPKIKSDTGDGSKDGAGCPFRIGDDGELPGIAVDMWHKAKKSVGIIRGPGILQGTGFLLKDNLVMTAYHVIKDIGDDNRKCLNRQLTENKRLSIQFDYQQSADTGTVQNYFFFTPDIQYYNPEIDVAVLKLFPDSTKDLPQSFEHFSPVQRGVKAHMIGHPNGSPLQIDPNIERFELSDELYRSAVDWSIEKYKKNGYIGILDSRKILFHCRFVHGASGCPGLYTDPTKENAEVVWMLLEGYPGFYYKNLTPAEQKNVPNDYLIEQGITMEAIWKDMSKENLELSLKIFGPRNERFIPI